MTTATVKPADFRVTADWHLHEWAEGGQKRLDRCVRALINALQREPVPPVLLVAGDLIHSRKGATPAALLALDRIMEQAHHIFDDVIVVPGNHDYPLRAGPESDNYPALWADRWPNIVVCDQAVVRTLHGAHRIACAPWRNDPEEYLRTLDLLKELDSEKGDLILLTHAPVVSASLANGTQMKAGYSLGVFYRFRMSIVGDIHVPQVRRDVANSVAANRRPRDDSKPIQTVTVPASVLIPGAPWSLDWGDAQSGAEIDPFHRCVWDVVVPLGFGPAAFQPVAVKAPRHLRVTVATKADLSEADVRREDGDLVCLYRPLKSKVKAEEIASSGVAFEMEPEPVKIESRLDVTPLSDPLAVFDAFVASGGLEEASDADLVRAVFESVLEQAGGVAQRSRKELRFTRLEAENFLCWGALNVNLNDRGLVFLDGVNEDDPSATSNGAGKSSLIEAVFFALTGRTLRGVRAADIRNRYTRKGEGWFVRLGLMAGSDLVVITRAKGMRSLNAPDGLSLELNGARIDQADPRDTQKRLDEILGVSADMLQQVLVFGQNVKLLFASASNAERKALLENLCSGGAFVGMESAAKAMLSNLVANRREMETEQITIAAELGRDQEQVERLSPRVAEAEARQQDWQQSNDLRIQRAEKELQIAEAAERSAKKCVETPSAEFERRWGAASEVDLEEARKASDDAKSRKLEATAKRNAAAFEVERLKKRSEAMRSKSGQDCPTCGQVVDVSHVEKVLATLKQEISEAETVELSAFEAEDQAAGALEVAKETEQKVRVRCQQLQDDYNKALRAEMSLESAQGIVRQKEDALKRQKSEQPPDCSYIKAALAEAETSLRAAEAKSKELRHKLEQMAGDIRIVESVCYLCGPQGLRVYLFDALSPAITEAANKTLKTLTDGTVQVRLKTSSTGARESVDLEVFNTLGGPTYESNSGGQRRKIDLAIAWAIHSLTSQWLSLLMIDEAFDSLDDVAAAKTALLLMDEAGKRGTVVVTSQRSDFKEAFPSVWTARRQGRISSLEVG